MKTRGYDPSVDSAVLLGVGSASGGMEPEDDARHPAGRLLLPDPEQRSGWREHYVKPPTRDKPGQRPIGFGRR